MSALDLVHTLARRHAIPASRVKDMRTSVQKLADAYHVSPDELDLAAIAPTYDATLKAYFAALSPAASVHTQRNTRANLRQLYRALAAHALLAGPVPPVVPRPNRALLMAEMWKTSPYRHRSRAVLPAYYLPLAQWPASIRDGWERYRAARTFELRPATLEIYLRYITPYVSFAVAIDQPPLSTWDGVFDSARLTRFVAWHAARLGEPRLSHTSAAAVRTLTFIANQLQHPGYPQLSALVDKLPAVPPVHNKQAPQHTISARELENVGLALLSNAREPLRPDRQPVPSSLHPRLLRAITHQSSLMIRLLWRVPLRNRSVREMQLGKNLYQDADGVWRLRYVGDELKVSQRGGQVNRLEVPWPTELVSQLEEYLHEFRPCMPNAATSPFVFLNRYGAPLSKVDVHRRLSAEVYIHLKKRLYPHLLRTLWVDQYLLASNGDVSTAAYMLNDNVQTVLKRYHELRGADHVAKAYAFNQAILGHGRE